MKFILVTLMLATQALFAGLNPTHFKVDVLAEGFTDPQEFVMLPNGKILICERMGTLKLWTPGEKTCKVVGNIIVSHKVKSYARECGFIGLTADPNFTKNGWLYCFYSVPSKHKPEFVKHKNFINNDFAAKQKEVNQVNRLSRFTFKNGKLDNSSEKILFDVPTDRYNNTCHEAGSLAFGPDGFLYISLGDNTNPFSKPATPIEEHQVELDAQRSSSNSNDLRGKVLRIKVNDDGTYSIPEGNLFKPGTPKTRPEIYAMGLRNPYRITLNSKTGTLYWGEIAPDKKPTGEEINQAKTAGYYGWPYVITDTKVFKDLKGKPFDPKNLKNTSKNNTGITDLPVPRPPLHYYYRSCSIIGEVYHIDPKHSEFAFPKEYDNCLFFADWNHSWFKVIRLDENENKVAVEDFPLYFKFRKPIDMFFHKGELYILEYGSGWYNVKNARLLKVSYSTSFQQIVTGKDDFRLKGMDHNHPGTKMLGESICMSCHTSQHKILGPSFSEVAERYAGKNKNVDKKVIENLVSKIKKGGTGVWGQQPMPPNPTLKDEDIKKMLDAILKTKKSSKHKK